MFSVGEIVVYVDVASRYHKEEAKIVSGPKVGKWSDSKRGIVIGGPSTIYLIKFGDGGEYVAEPHELRKKRPPEEYDGNTKVQWDDLIVWKPKEVVTV